MSGDDTERGQPFDGRYRVLGRLGVGGMATVYLAEDSSLGRKVALKVMAERYSKDGEFVERFRREAQAAARLNHPNIVAVYDRSEADGRPYIAMEYLQGRTLKQVIQAEGPLPPERAIAVAMQVLAGLRYAHEHGVVHRDVKPHNVLVGDDGRIKVTDFGIAHAGDPQMTEVGSIVGTAQYLSPEQARGRGVGPQTDIYSLGVVLYEMLAGRVPFEGDSSVAIAMQHVSDQPPPLRALAPECPSRSRSSSRTRCSRTRRSATAARTSSLPTSTASAGASCRSRPPRRTRRWSRASPPSSSRHRGDAHRAAPRDHSAARRRQAPPAADAAQALALALAARPAPAARGRRAGGVRARRRARRRLLDDDDLDEHPDDDEPGRLAHARRPRGQDLPGGQGDAARLPARARSVAATGARCAARGQHRGRQQPPSRRGAASRRHRAPEGLARAEGGPERRRQVAGRRQAAFGSDFRFQPTSEASDTIDKGNVTRTDPAVGTKIPVGSPVKVYVSSGPATVQVPNLVGKSEADARARWPAGLIVREPPGSRCSDNVDVGQGRQAEPGTGTPVHQGKAVAFDLANSPCTVFVPTVAACRSTRPSRACSARRSTEGDPDQPVTVTDPNDDGRVLDQDIRGSNTKPFVVTLTVGQLDRAPPRRPRRPRDQGAPVRASERVRIAVVAGGRSSEHAISLASARSVIEALDPARYDVVTC